jgi:site-specific recombinase XerD
MTAIRMLFSWFTEKGVLDMNPGREVKTEKFLRTEGKTPAFAEGDVQRLLDAIETFTHTGLRDRALLDTLAYTLPDRRRREPQSRRLLPQRETVFAPL